MAAQGNDSFAQKMKKAESDYYEQQQEEDRLAKKRERKAMIRNWCLLSVLLVGVIAAIQNREQLKEMVAKVFPVEEDPVAAEGGMDSASVEAKLKSKDPRMRAMGKAEQKINAAAAVNDERAKLFDELAAGAPAGMPKDGAGNASSQ